MIFSKSNYDISDLIPMFLCLIFPVILTLSLILNGCLAGPYNKGQQPGIPVIFSYRGDFQSVCISGDFNNWSRSQCLELQEKGLWTIRLFLTPGRYCYGFILDGRHWVPDPECPLEEIDGFGSRNSVLNLE